LLFDTGPDCWPLTESRSGYTLTGPELRETEKLEGPSDGRLLAATIDVPTSQLGVVGEVPSPMVYAIQTRAVSIAKPVTEIAQKHRLAGKSAEPFLLKPEPFQILLRLFHSRVRALTYRHARYRGFISRG